MSFRSTGQGRYGHVPPAQYGNSGAQGHPPQALQRNPSFNDGDDAAFFDPNTRPPQRPPAANPRFSYMPEEELFLSNTSRQAPYAQSSGLSPQLPSSPTNSSFQRQYQQLPNEAHSPNASQVQYNPQHFVRTMSVTSPQHSLYRGQSTYTANPTYNPSASYNPNSLYNPNTTPTSASAYGPHPPYNPAAYQAPSPPQGVHRQGTAPVYNSYPHGHPQQQPQMPNYWSPTNQNYGPPQAPRPAPMPYDQHPQQAYGAPTIQPPAPRPVMYNPPPSSPPYPPNGSTYPGGFQGPNAFAQYPEQGTYRDSSPSDPGLRSSQHSTYSTPAQQPSSTFSGSPSGGLRRHPTSRPLPSVPVDDDTSEDDYGEGISTEQVTQDAIYADIGNALQAASTISRQPSRNGDLLDDEMGGRNSYNSRSPVAGNHDTTEDDDDDESDLEAAAGLEAMRIADEEEAQGWGMNFAYEGQQMPAQPAGESSEDDFQNMDLSLVGGGYDARLSYGGDIPAQDAGESSEMEDQSRPLPTPQDLGRSDSYTTGPAAGLGGMTDYSLSSASEVHPFPAFEAARVDGYGTGGLQRPSHNHRLSFDSGDEQAMNARSSDSRQSGRSSNDSPSRGTPEAWYGAPSYARPLPSVPSISENRTTQLMPAGSYKSSHYQPPMDDPSRQPYLPTGPDGYPAQNVLSPGGQYVPRSSSLTSHSSAPQTVPPVRSKTDSEERRQRAAKQQNLRSASGLDGYDMGMPSGSVTLDLPALPAGRRKKFHPTKLSSAEFARCTEPWALGTLAAWARDVAGGDNGEGENDLRSRTLEEGFVALFTHKVPTMNVADAETLSSKVVASMLEGGVLLPDEEWVKFDDGEICGVLWQLTGQGCYSPRVHQPEIQGRCYSHHCTRTLKKINLHAQSLEPSRKSEDWVTFHKLTKEQIEQVPKKEVERQHVLHEIVTSEDLYRDHLNVLRILYRDDLVAWSQPIIPTNRIQSFVTEVFGKLEAVKDVNENHLLPQLKYRQKEQGPWIIGFSDIFREWVRKARSAYIEYAAGFPNASYLMRQEYDRNLLFRQFVDLARDNKMSSRLDWNTYLKAPITRLQRYTLLLSALLPKMLQQTEEKSNLEAAIGEIKAVTLECDAKVDEFTKKVQLIELASKLKQRSDRQTVELHLDHLGRQLVHQGDLQRPGNNRFTWLDTHAILFDHYLVLAKMIVERDATGRKEMYDVSKRPIPMQLLVLESTDDDPEKKSGLKGVGAVTTTVAKSAPQAADPRLSRTATNGFERLSTLEPVHSNSSLNSMNTSVRVSQSANDDGKAMYPFRIKHLGANEVYTLYAKSPEVRKEWCDKILEAKTRYAASLYEQNAEPFRLKVMADAAFYSEYNQSVSNKLVVPVRGTPLDRSIREMERRTGSGKRPVPICRAQVNCATAFTSYGRHMVAIGTDYGVYTAEASDPRGWSRAIQRPRVTQISVLEDFSLCLIIADKSLIAYNLDVICPPLDFPAPEHGTLQRAPQKLSGQREVSFFATARMKDRLLVFFKKKDSLHSTFKVLEPVYQKSSEKKNRFLSSLISGRRLGVNGDPSHPGSSTSGPGITESFREFDEFYIPTECYGINLFHSYIAVSTTKGFELLTLDKKQPNSIPIHASPAPAIANIAQRVAGQKPLGMFRLSHAEFLLAYEECAVYVDNHGEVSRSVVLEFVGRARAAALYGQYLVLFDNDFIEIRNAENGRLRQVIAGKEIRCLDYGVSPYGSGASNNKTSNASNEAAVAAAGYPPNTFGNSPSGSINGHPHAHPHSHGPGMGPQTGQSHGVGNGNVQDGRRTLKLAMNHPEYPGYQLVLEMVLNEGHSE